MASSDPAPRHGILGAWLRWAGSTPALCGAVAAAAASLLTILGVTATWLRTDTDTWWWPLVISAFAVAYVGGAALSLTVPRLRRAGRPAARDVLLPPLDPESRRWVRNWSRTRQHRLTRALGVILLGGGLFGVLAYAFGADWTGVVGQVASVLAELLGLVAIGGSLPPGGRGNDPPAPNP